MNIASARLQRLRFLARIVAREIHQLGVTDRRLFAVPFTRELAVNLEQEVELAERLDAFQPIRALAGHRG